MPYNGAGTFTSLGVPTFPAVAGTYILASYFNATMNDVFLGLSTAMPRDGQAAMTANMPMGGFKITGLGTGTNPTDAVNFAQVFSTPSFSNPTLTGVATFTGSVIADAASTFTIPSPPAADNSQKAAPTSFLVSYYANLTSPAFLGIPTAPTAAYGTDTNQLATMAALKDAIDLLPSGALPSITGKNSNWVLTPDSTGSAVQWSQLSSSSLFLNTFYGGF